MKEKQRKEESRNLRTYQKRCPQLAISYLELFPKKKKTENRGMNTFPEDPFSFSEYNILPLNEQLNIDIENYEKSMKLGIESREGSKNRSPEREVPKEKRQLLPPKLLPTKLPKMYKTGSKTGRSNSTFDLFLRDGGKNTSRMMNKSILYSSSFKNLSRDGINESLLSKSQVGQDIKSIMYTVQRRKQQLEEHMKNKTNLISRDISYLNSPRIKSLIEKDWIDHPEYPLFVEDAEFFILQHLKCQKLTSNKELLCMESALKPIKLGGNIINPGKVFEREIMGRYEVGNTKTIIPDTLTLNQTARKFWAPKTLTRTPLS